MLARRDEAVGDVVDDDSLVSLVVVVLTVEVEERRSEERWVPERCALERLDAGCCLLRDDGDDADAAAAVRAVRLRLLLRERSEVVRWVRAERSRASMLARRDEAVGDVVVVRIVEAAAEADLCSDERRVEVGRRLVLRCCGRPVC